MSEQMTDPAPPRRSWRWVPGTKTEAGPILGGTYRVVGLVPHAERALRPQCGSAREGG